MTPIRSNAISIGGGILTAFNACTEASLKSNENIIALTILIYITPPIARIIGALGYRVTSIESLGDLILIAGNTMPNLVDKTTPWQSLYDCICFYMF